MSAAVEVGGLRSGTHQRLSHLCSHGQLPHKVFSSQQRIRDTGRLIYLCTVGTINQGTGMATQEKRLKGCKQASKHGAKG